MSEDHSYVMAFIKIMFYTMGFFFFMMGILAFGKYCFG